MGTPTVQKPFCGYGVCGPCNKCSSPYCKGDCYNDDADGGDGATDFENEDVTPIDPVKPELNLDDELPKSDDKSGESGTYMDEATNEADDKDKPIESEPEDAMPEEMFDETEEQASPDTNAFYQALDNVEEALANAGNDAPVVGSDAQICSFGQYLQCDECFVTDIACGQSIFGGDNPNVLSSTAPMSACARARQIQQAARQSFAQQMYPASFPQQQSSIAQSIAQYASNTSVDSSSSVLMVSAAAFGDEVVLLSNSGLTFLSAVDSETGKREILSADVPCYPSRPTLLYSFAGFLFALMGENNGSLGRMIHRSDTEIVWSMEDWAPTSISFISVSNDGLFMEIVTSDNEVFQYTSSETSIEAVNNDPLPFSGKVRLFGQTRSDVVAKWNPSTLKLEFSDPQGVPVVVSDVRAAIVNASTGTVVYTKKVDSGYARVNATILSVPAPLTDLLGKL